MEDTREDKVTTTEATLTTTTPTPILPRLEDNKRLEVFMDHSGLSLL